jgi:hypothetical protein
LSRRLAATRSPRQAPLPTAAATAPPPLRTARAVLVVVLMLAGAGAAMGARTLTAHGPEIDGRPPFRGAWDARASFGPVRVERVRRLGESAFAGGHHTADEPVDELRVSLRVVNRLGRRIPYSPGQFRLRVGRTTITPVRPNPPPDALAAGHTLRQELAFVVPARRSTYTLVFDDLGRPRPLTVALGSLPSARKE